MTAVKSGAVKSRRGALKVVQQGLTIADFEELTTMLDVSHATLCDIALIAQRTSFIARDGRHFSFSASTMTFCFFLFFRLAARP